MSITENWVGGNADSSSLIRRRRSFMSGNFENYGKQVLNSDNIKLEKVQNNANRS